MDEAVKKALIIFQNIWALLDIDDLVGYQIWDVNQTELEENDHIVPLEIRWQSPDLGDWQLLGTVESERGKLPMDIEIE